MQYAGKLVISSIIGAVSCGFFSFALFLLFTLSDSGSSGEAFVFSIIVGMIGAFVGLWIGATVKIGKFGILGGTITGIIITLLIVLVYVFITGRPGQYAYFFSESRIIMLAFAIPTIASGIITALFNRRVLSS